MDPTGRFEVGIPLTVCGIVLPHTPLGILLAQKIDQRPSLA